MKIKLLQLNIQAGTYLSKIETFLSQHDFDILCFQEVAGPHSHSGNFHSEEDQFLRLKTFLETMYDGQLSIATRFSSDPLLSYDGNAIFYKKDFELLRSTTLTLHTGIQPFPSDAKSYEQQGRNALHLTLQKDRKTVEVVTAHLAWAPTQYEQPHQRKQNVQLIEYVKHLPHPFILTGDFNISANEQTILDLERYGQNLIKISKVKNTIDPQTHRAWDKIKPGFPVDYIFVSNDVKVNSFEALEEAHLSDHFGLMTEIQV